MKNTPQSIYIILLVGIVLILSGVIYSEHGYKLLLDVKDISSILKELGFACVIAFVVSVIIEKAARQEEVRIFEKYIKDSGSNVLKAIYGNNISDILFKFLDENVLSGNFIREDWKLIVNLEKVDDDSVSINVVMFSKIKNVSKIKRTYRGVKFVEENSSFGEQRFKKLDSLIVNGIDQTQELLATKNASPDGNHLNFHYDVELEPNAVAEIKTVMKLGGFGRDSEFLTTTILTERSEIFINYPDSLKVALAAVQPDMEYSTVPNNDGNTIYLSVDRPMLPFNGYVFWWAPIVDNSKNANTSKPKVTNTRKRVQKPKAVKVADN